MGRPTIARGKTWFRLDELVCDVKRFQNRSPVAAGYSEYGRFKGRSQNHIKELVDSLDTDGTPLDPLIVWQDPSNARWYVVDGFHRFEAYSTAIKEKRGWRSNKKIPCKVARGYEAEVICAVYKENRKAKLGFDQKQRLQFAWEELWRGRLDGLGVREAAERCNVGKTSVSQMRDLAATRYSDHTGPETPCLWEEAKNGDRDRPEESPESLELKQKAQEMTKELVELFECYGWHAEAMEQALRQSMEERPDIEVRELRIGRPEEGAFDF